MFTNVSKGLAGGETLTASIHENITHPVDLASFSPSMGENVVSFATRQRIRLGWFTEQPA